VPDIGGRQKTIGILAGEEPGDEDPARSRRNELLLAVIPAFLDALKPEAEGATPAAASA
jgi:hypothetical protein